MTRFLLLALSALVFCPAAARAQTTPAPTPTPAWTDHSRLLPDELRRLPGGLALWHSPAVAYPEANPAVPGGHVWKHRTSVRAETAGLQVVACGSYIWYSAAGWQTNLRQTPAEFAKLFNCPGGKLKKGVTYAFARNYRYAAPGQRLYGGDALWFILAKDAQGRLYKGYALIETEADVQAAK